DVTLLDSGQGAQVERVSQVGAVRRGLDRGAVLLPDVGELDRVIVGVGRGGGGGEDLVDPRTGRRQDDRGRRRPVGDGRRFRDGRAAGLAAVVGGGDDDGDDVAQVAVAGDPQVERVGQGGRVRRGLDRRAVLRPDVGERDRVLVVVGGGGGGGEDLVSPRAGRREDDRGRGERVGHG